MDQVAFKATLTRIKNKPVTFYIEHMDMEIYEKSPSSSSSTTTRTPTPPPTPTDTHTHTQPPPRPYKLAERVLDGMRIEVKELRLRLRTLGRRKCSKVGEWNPPGKINNKYCNN